MNQENKENSMVGQAQGPIEVVAGQNPPDFIGLINIADLNIRINEIPKPPLALYYRGDISLVQKTIDYDKRSIYGASLGDTIYVCIIGARSHTEYGRFITREIIKALQGQPIIIVSGLAMGIDTVALETALEYDIPTIAVIGSGLHDSAIYPASNIPLIYRILDKGGLLLSEYEPLCHATKWSFPMRNRIMAGFSDAIVVVEGSSKSGTLITARLGLEFGRDIIAVPGPITSPLSQGPLSLLEAGAIPLTKPTDILKILNLESEEYILYEKASRNEIYSRCSPEEIAILNVLATGPMDRDALLTTTGFAINKLQVILSMLDIKGLIVEKNGKIMKY